MTQKELTDFIGKVRRLFRGEMDEDIFALAMKRLSSLPADLCIKALDEYALNYGGSKGRFIPAKFFEYFERAQQIQTEARIRSAANSGASRAELDQIRVAEDWKGILLKVESLRPDDLKHAVDFLKSLGWFFKDPSPAAWSRTQLLAVHDLAYYKDVTLLDGKRVPAQTFYRSHCPKPQSFGL